MNRDPQPSYYPLVIASTIAGICFGLLVGYIVGAQQSTIQAPVAAVAPAASSSPPSANTVADEQQLKAFRDILAADPKNARAAIELGNRLYDAARYFEAVPYYQQALAIDPANVSVSTDLGTALWYSGRPDEALAQYEKSLAIDQRHAQTWFNIGIVRMDGRDDPVGAIAAWERLLTLHPSYADAGKVRDLVEKAKRRLPMATRGPVPAAGEPAR